jgi:hypothetical protein
MAANLPISSSVIADSTACRHLAMMPLLVRSNTNEESTNDLPFHDCPFHGIGRLVRQRRLPTLEGSIVHYGRSKVPCSAKEKLVERFPAARGRNNFPAKGALAGSLLITPLPTYEMGAAKRNLACMMWFERKGQREAIP